MLIVEDVDFQPYIAQAWVAFQADRVSKDRSKMCLCFDGVEIPPCKTLSDKAPKPETHRAIVLEEMEVLLYPQSSSEWLRLHQLQCQ